MSLNNLDMMGTHYRITYLITLLLACSIMPGAYGQHYARYVAHLSEEEQIFRNYKFGIKVLDDNGQEIRRTEPLFSDVREEEGFPLVAAGIPFMALEKEMKQAYGYEKCWVCLDEKLIPVFFFPTWTLDVVIKEGYFYYTNMASPFSGHWYWFGLINKEGAIIFSPPYSKILIVDSYCSGVRFKNTDEYLNAEDKASNDYILEVKTSEGDLLEQIELSLPDNVPCYGLFSPEFPDESEKDSKPGQPHQEFDFNMGLYMTSRLRLFEAKKFFAKSMEGDDPLISESAAIMQKIVAGYLDREWVQL